MTRNRTRWFVSVGLSFVLHVIVLATLAVLILRNDGHGDLSPGITGSAATTDNDDNSRTPDLRHVLDETDRAVEAMSHEQRAEEFERRRRDLRGVSEKSVDTIAHLTERVVGVETGRRYAPDPAATGQFDAASAVVYDIRTEQRNDQAVYVYVLVDKDGRSVEAVMPVSETSSSDRFLAKVMNWSREDAKLRRLVETAIKIAEHRVQDELSGNDKD